MSVLDNLLLVRAPSGETWAVPLSVIAMHRAQHYAYKFGGDEAKSLVEDTLPCFEKSEYEIHDWAANNMNWEDVRPCAFLLKHATPIDWQEIWTSGGHEIVKRTTLNSSS